MDFVKMTLLFINTSYKKTMSESDLVKFMLSGKIERCFKRHIRQLLDETPISIISGAVEQLSSEKNLSVKLIWLNLAKVAAELKSTNIFWPELLYNSRN